MENLPSAAELSAETSLGQSSTSRSQTATPGSSASSEMSDWDDPTAEGDFVVQERWNVSEDEILNTIAAHFLSETFLSEYQRTDSLDDSTSEYESEYEYEPAFEVNDYVRIQGQSTSQWAEKNPMGTYWSKKAYMVIEVRMGHQSLKPATEAAESGSDLDEDPGRSQSREHPATFVGDGTENAAAGPSGTIQNSLTSERKQELDSRVWYYRLDMSHDRNEHPFAQAMWWAEGQLTYDAEACSDLGDEGGEAEDEEMEDTPAAEDDTKQQSEVVTADFPLR